MRPSEGITPLQTALSNVFPLAESRTSAKVEPVFNLDTLRIFAFLLLVSLVLGALDLITLTAHSVIGSDQMRRVFNVDADVSIPSWFSTLQFFMAAMLVGAVAIIKVRAQDKFALKWALLAVIMLALSMDEASGIHESGTQVLNRTGAHADWVLLGIPFVVIVAALYLRFLSELPRRMAVLFVLAGGVLVAGALGVESVYLTLWTREATSKLGYLSALEEFLERTGVAIMIYAMLVYLREYMGFRGVGFTTADIDAHIASHEVSLEPRTIA